MNETWNKDNLKKASEVNIDEVIVTDIQDISTYTINIKSSPVDRIKAFLSQTNNPYITKSGNVLIKIEFSNDTSKKLSDLLEEILGRSST